MKDKVKVKKAKDKVAEAITDAIDADVEGTIEILQSAERELQRIEDEESV